MYILPKNWMKSLFQILLLVTIALFVETGCSSEDIPETEPILNVNPQILNFESTGGTDNVTVEATSEWQVQTKSGENWCHCNPKNNHIVEIIVDANQETKNRTAQISIRTDKLEKEIEVTQAGKITTDEAWKQTAFITVDENLLGVDWQTVNEYMKKYKFEYTEHSNNVEDNDDTEGIHIEVVKDETLGYNVFKFNIHASADADGNILVLDGDRGKREDRQRNEMKSRTGDGKHDVNGNWAEEQKLEWKFKIPKGFRPTKNFTHIHQLKAQEGNNGSPIITISLRADDNKGKNSRVQVIHTGDVKESNKGTIIDNLSLAEFEDEWIQVTTEMRYTHDGSYYIKMERIRDRKLLIEKKFEHIDMWRKGAIDIRNKFGIYRSYGGDLEEDYRGNLPTNGIKDESLYLTDFKVYEKNVNPNPQAHN